MNKARFIRFRDYVDVQPTGDITKWQKYADNLGGSPTLDIMADLTFAGIVTKNKAIYLPGEVHKGVGSWTRPYPKPVQLHHDDHADPIGRVVAARYIDTSNQVIGQDASRGAKLRDFVRKDLDIFKMKDKRSAFGEIMMLSESPSYSGLGRIRGHLRISDPDAITKVADGRFLTMSAGFRAAEAYCSTCLINDEAENWVDAGPCDHLPGETYEGLQMCLVPRGLDYDEESFVNHPALSASQVVELNTAGFEDSRIEIVTTDEVKRKTFIDLFIRKKDENGSPSVISLEDKEDTNLLSLRDRFEDMLLLVKEPEETEVEEKRPQTDPVKDFLVESMIGQDALSIKTHADRTLIISAHDQMHHRWDWSLKYDEGNPPKDEIDLHQKLHDVANDEGLLGSLTLGRLDDTLTSSVPPGYESKDKRETDSMLTFSDITQDTASNYKTVSEHIEDEKLRLSDEQLEKLEDEVFIGARRTFPVPDLAHAEAVRKVLDQVEEGEGLKALLTSYLEKREEKLKDSTSESDNTEDADVIGDSDAGDEDALAKEIAALKARLAEKDQMIELYQRNVKSLEDELDSANKGAVEFMKKAHALVAEKIADKRSSSGEKIDKDALVKELSSRSWESLTDTLKDLEGSTTRTEDSAETEGLARETDDSATIENPNEQTTGEFDLEAYAHIVEQYKDKRMYKGEAAADMWLDSLKRAGYFPKDAKIQ